MTAVIRDSAVANLAISQQLLYVIHHFKCFADVFLT